MNPWQALLGPVPLPPAATVPDEKDRNMAKRPEMRTAAGGRVHLVGDEPERRDAPWGVAKPAAQPAPSPRPPKPVPVLPHASISEGRSTIPGPVEIAFEAQGVCTVNLPAGSFLAEVFFPKIKHGARGKSDEKIAQPGADSPVEPETAPVPRKATPIPTPSRAAYRVKVPPPKPAMTYADAIAIRERARAKQPVDQKELLEANVLVQEVRRRAMPAAESYK